MATKRVKTRLADAGRLPPVPPPPAALGAASLRPEGTVVSADGSLTRRKLERSLVFGAVEAVFSLAEYFVLVLLCPTLAGLVLSVFDSPPSYPHVLRSCVFSSEAATGLGVVWQWLQTFGCIVSSDAFIIALHAVLATLACTAVVSWLLYRTVRTTQAKLTALPEWLGLTAPKVSNLTVRLIAYQLLVTLVLIGIQAATGSWYMGFSNFMAPDPNSAPETVAVSTGESENPKLVGYYNIFNLIFFDPIKEEIIFRGCLFYVLYHRSRNVVSCAVIANILFGLFHLINLFNGRFSSVYVALGVEIGFFYSGRFLLLRSMWEPIVLHVANNVIAMCIPIKDAATFSHPLVVISLAHTVTLYALLNVWTWRRVARHPTFVQQR